ncbi:hypothetical protein NHX12_001460 [Muraenolepis orangiensis]|uniref:Uncharacterized protein n=1 Tax=Muraenolepis orangiensis TaxID=630683 RepID=A0A9Q0IHA2_9TELE|nr:hypothetical protein NHX12_001458 [Muraenolepis orangiensis]KAJ3597945.1 hypothetical protein NHX12_001460 [Muraenolepis orangiensis]
MEVVYAYQSALDRRGEEEDLHYVNVIFTPLAENPEVDYIRGMDSKTAEYAQIRPHRTGSGDGETQEEEELYAVCF